jgi:hypothetical protein
MGGFVEADLDVAPAEVLERLDGRMRKSSLVLCGSEGSFGTWVDV